VYSRLGEVSPVEVYRGSVVVSLNNFLMSRISEYIPVSHLEIDTDGL